MVYKLFISHAFDHGELYGSIVTRLNRAKFDWIDNSVPRHRRYLADGTTPLPDAEMKALLAPHIDSCDVFVVIAKPIVGRRPWLRWELEYAKAAGKPVLAVWRRRVDLRVSMFALEKADRCVDTWNVTSIMNAIVDLKADKRFALRPTRSVDIRSIPEVSQLPETELVVEPMLVPDAGPLAPTEELALASDEKVVGETPKDVLSSNFVQPLFPRIEAIPVAEIIEQQNVQPTPEPPQQVLQPAIDRRRWWQFWKPRKGESARRN